MRSILKLLPGFKADIDAEDNRSAPVIRMHKNKTTFYQMIVFPFVDLNDPYKSTMFNVYTRDMEKQFVEGQYLSICPIRDIMILSGLSIWGRASEAYEWLHKLHCVSFKDMHPEIATQVPHRINMVFSNGEYEYPWERACIDSKS